NFSIMRDPHDAVTVSFSSARTNGYDSLLSGSLRGSFQRWRTLPLDRTLNGIHTLLQNPRFLILDTASLTATNVATHPHRQRSAAIAHVAIHAQYDSRAFAPGWIGNWSGE